MAAGDACKFCGRSTAELDRLGKDWLAWRPLICVECAQAKVDAVVRRGRRGGELHVDVGLMAEELGLPKTEAVQDLLAAAVRQAAANVLPGVPLEERSLFFSTRGKETN